MKGFQKLALASAITALPAAGMAMEPMNDSEMSDVTGQDGLAISMNLEQTLDVLIVDRDGLDADATTPSNDLIGPDTHVEDGGIHIADMGIGAAGGSDLDIEIDAGGDGTNGVLVTQVSLANGFEINTGSVSAVDASTVASLTDASGVTPGSEVLSPMTITFNNGLDFEIELGDGADQFLFFSDADAGDISVAGFELTDVTNAESLSFDLELKNINLTGTSGDIVADGLQLTLGANLDNVEVGMENMTLGGGTIGDVYITGLDMSGDTITIGGK